MNDTTSVVMGQFGPMRKVSQRLQDFLKEYPPHDGWGIRVESKDPLSCRPGLLELHKECIRCGRSPRSLPDLEDSSWKGLVFVAHLTKDGKDQGTNDECYQEIFYQYDYETGVTRAKGRLLSALGFGPEVLDEDERRIHGGDRGERLFAETPTKEEPDYEVSDADPDLPDVDEEVKTTVDLPKPKQTSFDIPPHIQSQVDAFATILRDRGVDVELPTTKKEALKFLRQRNSTQGVSS